MKTYSSILSPIIVFLISAGIFVVTTTAVPVYAVTETPTPIASRTATVIPEPEPESTKPSLVSVTTATTTAAEPSPAPTPTPTSIPTPTPVPSPTATPVPTKEPVVSGPALKVIGETFQVGDKITVTYSGMSGKKDGRIGMFEASQFSNTTPKDFQEIGSEGAGSIDFTAPKQTGEYEFRILSTVDRNRYNREAESGTFNVLAAFTPTATATVTLTPAPDRSGEEDGGRLDKNEPAQGAIDYVGDSDLWNFNGAAGMGLTISVNPSSDSNIDAYIELTNSDGDLEKTAGGGGESTNAIISGWIPQQSGQYRVRVSSATSTGGYAIEVAATEPSSAPPKASLSSSDDDELNIIVSWEAPESGDEYTYAVYVHTSPEDKELVGSTSHPVTELEISADEHNLVGENVYFTIVTTDSNLASVLSDKTSPLQVSQPKESTGSRSMFKDPMVIGMVVFFLVLFLGVIYLLVVIFRPNKNVSGVSSRAMQQKEGDIKRLTDTIAQMGIEQTEALNTERNKSKNEMSNLRIESETHRDRVRVLEEEKSRLDDLVKAREKLIEIQKETIESQERRQEKADRYSEKLSDSEIRQPQADQDLVSMPGVERLQEELIRIASELGFPPLSDAISELPKVSDPSEYWSWRERRDLFSSIMNRIEFYRQEIYQPAMDSSQEKITELNQAGVDASLFAAMLEEDIGLEGVMILEEVLENRIDVLQKAHEDPADELTGEVEELRSRLRGLPVTDRVIPNLILNIVTEQLLEGVTDPANREPSKRVAMAILKEISDKFLS